jgi:nucleoside-diphosphate-sugar epimerase
MLVTGGAGLTGPHVAGRLAAGGRDVGVGCNFAAPLAALLAATGWPPRRRRGSGPDGELDRRGGRGGAGMTGPWPV